MGLTNGITFLWLIVRTLAYMPDIRHMTSWP